MAALNPSSLSRCPQHAAGVAVVQSTLRRPRAVVVHPVVVGAQRARALRPVRGPPQHRRPRRYRGRGRVGIGRRRALRIGIELRHHPDHGREAAVDALDVGEDEELLAGSERGEVRREAPWRSGPLGRVPRRSPGWRRRCTARTSRRLGGRSTTKFGDSAMFADGLSGGTIPCVATATGAAGAAGGAGRFGAGGRVVAGVGGGVGRGALSAVAAVEVGTGIVATGTGAVVVGVGATGWKKAIQARGPAEPVGDDAEAVADRADAGSIAVRTTRERATRVTTPTRAEVPAMGMRRSRTRRRVSELDTPWLSASAASRFKTSPWVVWGRRASQVPLPRGTSAGSGPTSVMCPLAPWGCARNDSGDRETIAAGSPDR